MKDIITSSLYGKNLKIVREFNRGGQGIVWNTDDHRILLKQFEPTLIADDTQKQRDLRLKAEIAYKAFCEVNKGTQVELSCLPREYLTFCGNPAYLMQRAEGELLQTLLRNKKIAKENKLQIVLALARALRKLHSAQMLHSDINPENYMLKHDRNGWTAYILDMDGGGLLSPPGPVYPMSQPKRIYKAPELSKMNWKQLHEKSLFFAPDQWALAVLIYQILVDYCGPFSTVQNHPDPAVKDYIPFKMYAYRDTSIHWPMPWQVALMNHAKLPDKIISLFHETFQYRFDIADKLKKRYRPTAAQWEEALRSTIALSPIGRIYALPTKSKLSREVRLPSRVTVKSSVTRKPSWAKAVWSIFLPIFRVLPRFVYKYRLRLKNIRKSFA